jgi:hypothetical protein
MTKYTRPFQADKRDFILIVCGEEDMNLFNPVNAKMSYVV